MRSTKVKTSAGGFRRALAFFVVSFFTLLLIGFGSPASAAPSGTFTAKIYTGYYSADTVRPMDDPNAVNNYSLCKTQALNTLDFASLGTMEDGCGTENILIHYTGYVYSPVAQTLTFRAWSDDGFFAKVGGLTVVDAWRVKGCDSASTGTSVTFTAGQYKTFDAWFFQGGWGHCAQLEYSSNSVDYAVVPQSMFSTAVNAASTFSDKAVLTQTTLGSNYSDGVTATNGTFTYSVDSGALPDGLTLDSATGAITGTTTTAGTYTFNIKATDTSGSGLLTGNLTITVGTSVSLTTGLSDKTLWTSEAVSFRAVFSGSPAPTVALGARSGALPPGLTLANDGTISGTPTTAGTYTFNLRAWNFTGSSTAGNYTYTVQGPPVITGGASFSQELTYGSTYSHKADVTGSSVTYTLDGSLPAGLTLNSSTGLISGRANDKGVFNFKVKATNRAGSVWSDQSTISVSQIPAFTNTALASSIRKGQVGYSFGFEANAYPAATFSISSGSLPTGMSLSSAGVLSGTPTVAGKYTFTVQATNTKGSTQVIRTLTISQAPVAKDTSLLNQILAGRVYADAIEYEGYPDPRYRVSEGSLPDGLSLNTLSGAITGSATTGGVYGFKIAVRAGTDEVTTELYSLIVNQIPVKIDETVAASVAIGAIVDDGVSATGYPAPTYALKSGALPTGLVLDPATGSITGTATSGGTYDFVIEAVNAHGSIDFPLTMAVQSTPTFLPNNFPTVLNLNDSVSTKFTADGFPSPIYSVASGALPEGLNLDAVSGMVTGTVANGGDYTFTIGATNELGTTATEPINVKVNGTEAKIAVEAQIGEVVSGKTITIASDGLKPQSPYQVVLRSTPQVIDSGKTSKTGSVSAKPTLPAILEPGWHSITVTSLKSDGTKFEKAVYFQVTENLNLEEVSEQEPTAAQRAEALTNDPEFYARMGIDPAGTVAPAAVAEQVAQVASVVSSVALVSAAAAGAAAAASAAASAGGAASAAGSSAGGSARAGGSSSSSSSSGGTRSASGSSSGGGSTSSSSGGDSDNSDSGDYGNLEAEHDDFEVEAAGRLDGLAIWKNKWVTLTDEPLTRWIESSARVSPVLSRILNDGSYVRALVGSLSLLGYFAALVLGAAAVDPSAQSLATSGRVGLLVLIMAIGTLDALAGLVAMSAFAIMSLITHPVAGIGDFRYLLAMFILGFAPSIMATTFRKIRRPAIENLSDGYERLVDLALIGFISVLTVMSLVGSVSAFAGVTVPLSKDVKPIALAIAGVAIARVVLEELAARLAPERLNRINPTEVPGTFDWQPWASLVLKFSVLIIMIGGMVGMGWHLWVGAVLIFLPGIIGMVFPNLPSFKWIHEFIPGGVGALAFATLISSWSGMAVNALLGKSELYGQLSFILIPLPVILISIVGMFGQSEDKLWQRLNKRWVYIAGGISVFLFTVQVTDFIPTIFG
jgi:hypothetical protein